MDYFFLENEGRDFLGRIKTKLNLVEENIVFKVLLSTLNFCLKN